MYNVEGLSSSDNNVSFRVSVDNMDFFFRLHIFRDILYCSIWMDNYLIVDSVKCINNAWLLPYKYLATAGNFRFEDSFDEYISASNFGNITKLKYYSREEYLQILNEG